MFTTFIYTPLYNALVAILSILPHADVGVAIILLTIAVKVILFPLARQAIKTQVTLKRIAPELKEINEKHKDNNEEKARATLKLYKESGVRPLASFLVVLIQLPLVFGLYWVFMKGGLPNIDTSYLYTFITPPTKVAMDLFGVVDIGGRSVVLAILAGVSQFFVGWFAIQTPETTTKPGESLKDDVMRSLHLQMRYGLPVVVMVAGFAISAAVSLYWTVSNLFTLVQEILVRRKMYGRE